MPLTHLTGNPGIRRTDAKRTTSTTRRTGSTLTAEGPRWHVRERIKVFTRESKHPRDDVVTLKARMDEVTAQARPTAGDLDRIQAALADTIDHTRNLLGADLSRLREIQEAERGQAHSRHDDLERQLDQIARRIEATLDGTWARMAQDGKWVDPVGQPQPAWPPPTGPPRYDYGLIAALEALIAESEPGWHQLYSELGLTPYRQGISPASAEAVPKTPAGRPSALPLCCRRPGTELMVRASD